MNTYMKLVITVIFAVLIYGVLGPAFVSANNTIAVLIGFGLVLASIPLTYWFWTDQLGDKYRAVLKRLYEKGK